MFPETLVVCFRLRTETVRVMQLLACCRREGTKLLRMSCTKASQGNRIAGLKDADARISAQVQDKKTFSRMLHGSLADNCERSVGDSKSQNLP